MFGFSGKKELLEKKEKKEAVPEPPTAPPASPSSPMCEDDDDLKAGNGYEMHFRCTEPDTTPDAGGDNKESAPVGEEKLFCPASESFHSHSTHSTALPPTTQLQQEYLDELMKEKTELRSFAGPASHRMLHKLLDNEIQRVISAMSTTLSARDSHESLSAPSDDGPRVTLQEKIFVPVDKYPRYNFVGRILGPRGMTAKQLEEETGCKIMVRGRGSSRGEPLHVLIQCDEVESRAKAKMDAAIERITALLHPPPEGKDELKRKQLIELSIINGTYRPTSATKVALQQPRGHGSPFEHHHMSYQPNPFEQKPPMNKLMGKGNGLGDAPSADDQLMSMAHLVNLLAATSPFQQNDVYKHLISMSLSDPGLFAQMFGAPASSAPPSHPPQPSSFGAQGMGGFGGAAPIPQANLQQYMTAAAMLQSVPFAHDGSGDAPKGKR